MFERLAQTIDERQNGGRFRLEHLARECQIDPGRCNHVVTHIVTPCDACGFDVWRRQVARRGVNPSELQHQGFELVQAKRIGGIALGASGLFVHFHEHRIDASAHSCRCERFDVLGESGCDAVAGTR